MRQSLGGNSGGQSVKGYISLGFLYLSLTIGCAADDGGPCGRDGPSAIAVDVRDGETGQSSAVGARGAAQTGSRTDSVLIGQSALFPDRSSLAAGRMDCTRFGLSIRISVLGPAQRHRRSNRAPVPGVRNPGLDREPATTN